MSTIRGTSNNAPTGGEVDRPQFAVTLGLLPPYTIDDVKRAYLNKVKHAHPDHGGDRRQFDNIQHAFEQAQSYLRFRSDRRQWIAARMDEYLAVLGLLERLDALGANVETVTLDWVRRSFGDFASMTESIVAIRLADSPHAPAVIDAIVAEHTNLQALKRLELPGCPIDDSHAWQLRVFRQLTHLDLSRTKISPRAVELVDWLPALVSFSTSGTSIGWLDRLRLNRKLRKRRAAIPDPVVHPVNIR